MVIKLNSCRSHGRTGVILERHDPAWLRERCRKGISNPEEVSTSPSFEGMILAVPKVQAVDSYDTAK